MISVNRRVRFNITHVPPEGHSTFICFLLGNPFPLPEYTQNGDAANRYRYVSALSSGDTAGHWVLTGISQYVKMDVVSDAKEESSPRRNTAEMNGRPLSQFPHAGETDPPHGKLAHAFAVSIPIALLWILYHSVTDAWWTYDDPAILKSILQNGVLSHFYIPDIWRQFTNANLTPWLQLSLGLDLHLFGLKSTGYYYHHLISFSLVILLGYLVLKLFFPPWITGLVLMFFVVSLPSAATAQLLMVRHYLEGLGLSLLAIWFYLKAFRTETSGWVWAGSLFYLLACATKEIYVPLVVVLFFFPIGSLQQRWRKGVPFALVAAGYVLWRAYMLGPGNILSGYGDVHGRPGLKEIANLPRQMANVAGWDSAWYWVILALAILPLLFSLVRERSLKKWSFVAVLTIVIIAPIIPVIPVMSERYLFLPVFMAAIVFGTGLEFYRKRGADSLWARLFVLLLSLCLLVPGSKAAERFSQDGKRTAKIFRTAGEFVLYDADETAVLINPPGPVWFHQSLLWIRETALRRNPGPKVCYDLCTCKLKDVGFVYEYKNGTVEKVGPLQTAGRIDCGNESAALTVEMHCSSDTLHWRFGPYSRGQYYFSGSSESKDISGFFYALPAEGHYAMKLPEQLNFVIKYVSPEGWRTYSPVLTIDRNSDLDKRGKQKFYWGRPQ